jgi:hypothetical protein
MARASVHGGIDFGQRRQSRGRGGDRTVLAQNQLRSTRVSI